MTPSSTSTQPGAEVAPGETSARASTQLPDFFIIGAAKSGTTTMHDYLARHPAIWMSAVKEPRFFDPYGLPEMRDPKAYHKLFEGAGEHQRRGESSTPYSDWPRVPNVPQAIHKALPQAQFIYLLREPVARAYAHYAHLHLRELLRGQARKRTFEEYLTSYPSLVDASDYALQIRRYLEFFPKESLLPLPFERFSREPAWALRRVFEFLGVEDLSETLAQEPVHSNSRRDLEARETRDRIYAPFLRVPGLRLAYGGLPQSLRSKLFSTIERSFFGRRIRDRFTLSPMLPETRLRLRERFDPSTEYLVKEFGFDPSSWNREPTK